MCDLQPADQEKVTLRRDVPQSEGDVRLPHTERRTAAVCRSRVTRCGSVQPDSVLLSPLPWIRVRRLPRQSQCGADTEGAGN